ncbi:MAG: DegT/DnrJ/EryC1/StrS family aminotransferase [Bacteroidia bacterium]|nr:DegT/DnrJ/EryC1/StrS family aminotransferase [Bacteroidia bacterium]
MKKMQMVDLIGQYQKIKPEVDQAIQNVLNSSAFINGPDVKSFAGELASYLNVKHVIPCANGTDALQIAMMAFGFRPGDEVITTSFTYVATCEVIALLKLKPVLVEVNPDTFTIDPVAFEKAISSKTVAVVPVHLFGQCADMDEIMRIAGKHNLKVIEDTAQAIGADYKMKDGAVRKAGTIGHVGTTSFFPSKNLGCYGDGGALFTNDDDLARKIRMMANHGQSVQYVFDEIGCNSRLDTIQAAILRIKLRHLDEYAAARNRVAAFYDKAFAGIPQLKTPLRNPDSTHVFHQYTLTLDGVDREKLREHLASKGIPSNVYYPIPVHLQKAYRDNRYAEGSLPLTEYLSKNVLSLPIHTEMTEEELSLITSAVKEFLKPD